MPDNIELVVDSDQRDETKNWQVDKRSISISIGTVIAVVTLTTTVVGFFVFQVFLTNYTTIANHLVIPSQYIGAGIAMWVFTLVACFIGVVIFGPLIFTLNWVYSKFGIYAYISSKIKNRIIHRIVDAVILFALPMYGLSRLTRGIIILPFNYISLQNLLTALLLASSILFFILVIFDFYKTRSKVAHYIIPVVMIFVSLITISVIFGRYVYGTFPRTVGGGEPIQIHIIHKNYTENENLGLKNDDEGRSETVCLLANLFEGLLVYNPRTFESIVVATGPQTNYLGHTTSYEKIYCHPRSLREFCFPETPYDDSNSEQTIKS